MVKSTLKNIKKNSLLYIKLAFVALTFAVMVISSYLYVNNILHNHLIRDATDMLNNTKLKIESELLSPKISLSLVSQNIEDMIKGGGDKDTVLAYMLSVNDYMENDNNFSYNGVYGYFNVFGGAYFDGAQWGAPTGLSPLDRSWYTSAVSANGGIVSTPPYIQPDTGKMVMSYAQSIYDKKGALLGVIGMDLPLSDIQDYVTALKLTTNGYGILVDANFTIISHPKTEYIGYNAHDINSRFQDVLESLAPEQDLIEKETTNYQNQNMIMFACRLNNGWILTVSTPPGEYYRELTDMALVLCVMGAILAAALMVIILRVDQAKHKADEEIQRKSIQFNEAKSANNAKSAFLANMSHEMRTPLNVVKGLSDLRMEDVNLPDGLKEDLRKINSAGAMLLGIVNDVLDLSKIEAGKLQIAPIVYTTASLLNDIITLNMIRIDGKPILFQTDISKDTFYELYGDDLRVAQICNNLLTNAFKYTNEGRVDLSVRTERGGDKYVWLMISVSDTGIGIRPENLKNLFSAFSQADIQANRKIEGTGLGLSITKKLVEMMDGEISVESEYGKGTTFNVRLRQGYVNEKVLGEATVESLRNFKYTDNRQHVTSKLVRLDLSYAAVLVVDDFPTNLDVAAGMMRKYKMRVDCVTSGQAAIDRIKRGEPVYNAIFMDHMMPEIDGIEATRLIRGIDTEYARKVPIIALTANAIAGNDKLFLNNGFQAFLSKPIDILKLDAILKEWVAKTEETSSVEKRLSPGAGPGEGGDSLRIPGVDVSKGLMLYGGDMDLYLTILRSYAASAPSILAPLSGVTGGNLHEYAINVHGLKGSSASIGAEEIRELAQRLETAAKSGDLPAVLSENEVLLKDTQTLVDGINSRLSEICPKGGKPRLAAPDTDVLTKLKQSCEQFDMSGVDEAMDSLEQASYDNGGDFVEWLREKIDASDFTEAAAGINEYIDNDRCKTDAQCAPLQ